MPTGEYSGLVLLVPATRGGWGTWYAAASDQPPPAAACPITVSGRHAPSLVLKDNDLNYKLRLRDDDAKKMAKQLRADANLLRKLGVMDYSLLLGIRTVEYDVFRPQLVPPAEPAAAPAAPGFAKPAATTAATTTPSGPPHRRSVAAAMFGTRPADDARADRSDAPPPPTPRSSALPSVHGQIDLSRPRTLGSNVPSPAVSVTAPAALPECAPDGGSALGAAPGTRADGEGAAAVAVTPVGRRSLSAPPHDASRARLTPLAFSPPSADEGCASHAGDGGGTGAELGGTPAAGAPFAVEAASRFSGGEAGSADGGAPLEWALAHSRMCQRQSHVVTGHFYYGGVIDILQRWTWKKRCERVWKVWVLRRDPDGISCIPPDKYYRRFSKKIDDLLLVQEDSG